MEPKFLLLNALNESLVLSVWDYNDHRKDTLLGSATFELPKLIEDATQEDITSHFILDGKVKGDLRYDLSWYPVIEAEEGKELGESSKLASVLSTLLSLSLSSNRDRPSYYSSSKRSRSFEIPGRFKPACASLRWEYESSWTYDPYFQAHQQSCLGVSVRVHLFRQEFCHHCG